MSLILVCICGSSISTTRLTALSDKLHGDCNCILHLFSIELLGKAKFLFYTHTTQVNTAILVQAKQNVSVYHKHITQSICTELQPASLNAAGQVTEKLGAGSDFAR